MHHGEASAQPETEVAARLDTASMDWGALVAYSLKVVLERVADFSDSLGLA